MRARGSIEEGEGGDPPSAFVTIRLLQHLVRFVAGPMKDALDDTRFGDWKRNEKVKERKNQPKILAHQNRKTEEEKNRTNPSSKTPRKVCTHSQTFSLPKSCSPWSENQTPDYQSSN